LAELGNQIFRGQWRKLRHFHSYHQFEQAAGENILQKNLVPKCLQLIFRKRSRMKVIFEYRFLKNIVTLLVGEPPNRVPRGGPQESKTGRSVPPLGVPESAQTFSAFFRKLQNYHWKRPFWSEGENYFKIRPLNRLRMPCNVHGGNRHVAGPCRTAIQKSIYRIFTNRLCHYL